MQVCNLHPTLSYANISKEEWDMTVNDIKVTKIILQSIKLKSTVILKKFISYKLYYWLEVRVSISVLCTYSFVICLNFIRTLHIIDVLFFTNSSYCWYSSYLSHKTSIMSKLPPKKKHSNEAVRVCYLPKKHISMASQKGFY